VFRFGLLGIGGDGERRWLAGVVVMTCTLLLVLWLALRPFIILAFKILYFFFYFKNKRNILCYILIMSKCNFHVLRA